MDKKEMISRIRVLSGLDNLDEKEQAELEGLNKSLSSLKAKEDAVKALASADADAEAEREAETDKKIAAAIKADRELQEVKANRLSYSEAPMQSKYSDTYKYDNVSPADLSLAIETGKKLGVNFKPGAFKAMSLRVAELKDNNTEKSRQDVAYIKGYFKAKTKTNIEPTKEGVETAIKAETDPMYTGGANIGADWVGSYYSTQIWNTIRAENRIAGMIPSEALPDGYSNTTIPLESTDLTWYKVPEASASDSTLKYPAPTIPASQIGTGSKNIPIGKVGARGIYSGELNEDSIIRFAPQLRAQMEVSGAETVESMFIDGDVETSASKNINAIDTTPTSTDYYLMFDGFRKLALVTNTANSRNATGSLTIEDFLATMQLMGTAGIAAVDPTKVGFIVDGNTFFALARLPEVKTRDVNSAATVENGFVKLAWGVNVMPSYQMHRVSAKRMANTAGKIDADTDSNNTTGSILSVRWDQWKQVFKREMTIETTRVPASDSYEIVALARLGLAYRDAEASAITYNVGV